MPNRTTNGASRAEARRRARLVARGEPDATELDETPEAVEPARKPSFLERIIPPAPQLAGRPDPLAGFGYEGRFPRLMAGLYVLRQNPLPWVAAALFWAGLALVLPLLPQDGVVFLVANIAQYIALIAAGWFGWQRPWLFGVIAAVAGLAVWTVWVGIFPDQYLTAGSERPTLAALAVYYLYQAPVQLLLGFVAGWYGGYLRRRLADQRPPEDRSRKRR
jgi:hypothetical protein